MREEESQELVPGFEGIYRYVPGGFYRTNILNIIYQVNKYFPSILIIDVTTPFIMRIIQRSKLRMPKENF